LFKKKIINVFDEIGSGWSTKDQWIKNINGNDNRCIEILRKHIRPNMSILDVGCGSGKLLANLIKIENNLELIGLEPANGMRRNDCSNMEIIGTDLENYDAIKKFDIIILKQVLHHIEDKEKALIKLKSMLKPEGIIFIMIPSQNYQSNIIEYSENDLLGRINYKEMHAHVKNTGLSIKEHRLYKAETSFDSIYDYFKFMVAIGGVQKIYNYDKDDYKSVEKFVELYKSLFENTSPISIDCSYAYYICGVKTDTQDEYNQELEIAFDKWSSTYEKDVIDKIEARGYSYEALGQKIGEYLSHDDKIPNVLELGVGTGVLGERIYNSLEGKMVSNGIDISPGMLSQAAHKGIYESLVCFSADEYAYSDKYDSIYSAFMFHSVKHKKKLLQKIKSILKEDGVLVIVDLVPQDSVVYEQLAHSRKYEYGAPSDYLTYSQLLDLFEDSGYTPAATEQLGIDKDYNHFMFVLRK